MRFVIGTLAFLSAVILGLASLISVLAVVIVAHRWTDGRYPAGAALLFGAVSGAMSLLFGWMSWRVMRHLRAPDHRTAKDVFAVAGFLFAVQVLGALRPGTKGSARDYGPGEWVAAMAVGLVAHAALSLCPARPRRPGLPAGAHGRE